jgi:hypothetical protein
MYVIAVLLVLLTVWFKRCHRQHFLYSTLLLFVSMARILRATRLDLEGGAARGLVWILTDIMTVPAHFYQHHPGR